VPLLNLHFQIDYITLLGSGLNQIM